MIGRRRPPTEPAQPEPRSFDDFELKLGDIMRGERATIGKSLLDVQRELKIKATYIAAIENADTSAFETPGFIAGYVRSYARYLGLDSDWAYATFCEEANFVSAMAAESTSALGAVAGPVFRKQAGLDGLTRDPIAQPRVSYAPEVASALSQIEPRAVGSVFVLLALIGGIGYGGYSILQEIQRVQIAPVDRAPAVAQVDPVANVTFSDTGSESEPPDLAAASADALYEIYRPEPLDAPVMTTRDGPIAGLDPSRFGPLANAGGRVGQPLASTTLPVSSNLTPSLAPPPEIQPVQIASALSEALEGTPTDIPRVTAEDVPEVMIVAVNEAWIRIRAADGSVLKEATLQPCETYVVPATDVPPTLRVGDAGALFFTVKGVTYGPAGDRGQIGKQIALSPAPLTEVYAQVDPDASDSEREAVRYADAALGLQAPDPTCDVPQ